MAEAPLLEGRALRKHYGGVRATDDVSFTLESGQILGLVGPNGAGKTTLVDLIAGALPADRGELLLEGRRLTGPASARSRLGLARTFQHPQLALDLSLHDNVLLGRAGHRTRSLGRMITGVARGTLRPRSSEDDELVRAVASELGLERLGRRARDITLGEQRLVEVGRALVQNPLVLLLDEPFAGSDASGVAGIIDVIRTVQQRGHGVILVDHNVDLVAALADGIVLLDQGRVAFDGDARACLASPEMRAVYFGERGRADVG